MGNAKSVLNATMARLKISAWAQLRFVAALALGLLFASPGHAATLSSSTSITPGTALTDSSTLGPASITFSLAAQYTSSHALYFAVNLVNAQFSTTASVTLSVTGSSGVSATGICGKDLFTDHIIVTCIPTGTDYITGLTIGGIVYTNVTALNTSGATISASGGAKNSGLTLFFETFPSTTLVTSAVTNSTNYTLTTSTTGSGSGTITASPTGTSFASGTVVTLTAAAATGSTFGGWTGATGCTSSTTCQVTMSANQTVSAAFTSSASPRLTVSMTGTGVVTSSPAGVTCGSTCNGTFTSGSSVTLTAIPVIGALFDSWSGCTSSTATTCTVTMSTDKTVTASFGTTVAIYEGAVYSSTQTAALSFLRFYNAGSSAGTVSVTLADYATGQTLTTWTSPSIAPGAAPQYGISTLESAATTAFTKPSYYALRIQSQFNGTFQHILYKPSNGVVTNASTCDSGITSPATRLVNVHSSRLETAGFPSQIVIHNTGSSAATASLAITDASNAASLGTYTSASIPAKGVAVLLVSAIESSMGFTPTSSQVHYVVNLTGSFSGYLQHRVNNQQAGVITDMSTVCAFNGS